MRQIVVAIALVISLVPYPGQLRAEPDPLVSWLMNEPATLFDIGMLRLNETLDLIKPTFRGDLIASASYSWEQNRIRIGASAVLEKGRSDFKSVCKKVIKLIRRYGGGLPEFDPSYGNYPSNYSEFFKHFDYERKNAPDKYRQKLDQIFQIEVEVVEEDAVYDENVLARCDGPLMSNKVYFEE